MSELLELSNGSVYTLCVNGIHNNDNTLFLKLVKPADKTLDTIKKEFSNPENLSVLKTKNSAMTIRVDSGYVYLNDQMTITDNYVVATDISDDDVVQKKDTVIELSLSSAADTTGEVTDGDN